MRYEAVMMRTGWGGGEKREGRRNCCNAVSWGEDIGPVYIHPERMAPEKRVRLFIISSGVSNAAVRDIREYIQRENSPGEKLNRRRCGLGACMAAALIGSWFRAQDEITRGVLAYPIRPMRD
jgi:hypothetical protein